MARSGPKVTKLFSCSTQLSIKFIKLINVKMPTVWHFNIYEDDNTSFESLKEIKVFFFSILVFNSS